MEVDRKAETQEVIQGAVVNHPIDVFYKGYREKNTLALNVSLNISFKTIHFIIFKLERILAQPWPTSSVQTPCPLVRA